MKVTMFHFMPYRELPADFPPKGMASAWVDTPWWQYGDANKVTDFYNSSIDELMLAAKLGFDGLGLNEHHQNPYGFMCNPNLFGAILARMTAEQGLAQVALVQLGATISSCPPIRLAEEYAVLDCISGGRLIAGLPTGLGNDVSISNGITPMEHRERWREGVELMLKAWTAKEFFAWNGKYTQLPKVNLWPRPVQEPHPPVLIPGAASSSTWDYCHDRNFPYAYLSYFGGKSAEQVMDRFWSRAAAKGRDANPYRAAFLQVVGVAETDRQAEEEYGKHVEYFYHKLLHLPLGYIAPPGNADYKSLLNVLSAGKNLLQISDFTVDLKPLKAKDMIEREFVVVGSPATVRQKLEAMAKRLNVGHLMVALQFGSMPHEQAKKNIELFGREVLPQLQTIWEDKDFENHWWPKKLRKRPVKQREMAAASG
jgi:alkanesulfonate monooxygenase SsuD/methylene tetrahydromethanopterin reductase-like flavin-dependent oxidoreductase (luciferase family)